MRSINRRTFVADVAAAGALSAGASVWAASPHETVAVAIMGVNDRGSQLARLMEQTPSLRIACVCDPDERAIVKGIEASSTGGRPAPRGVKDFRTALDDPAIDALVVAAPNHWHATAAILAMQAGKDVYVEKPCSHTAEEGELMQLAAEKFDRVVQVGMQRRSSPMYQQAVAAVRDGAIGDPLYAKSWYYRQRPSIGHGARQQPPAWLDYDLWQGPATEKPYRENILHYNWHFFWHWGDGELGNNGVHTIDLCRWALDVAYPTAVTTVGERVRYEDDQQTPDTTAAHFACGDKFISWEAVSWSPPMNPAESVGVEIRGTDGWLRMTDPICRIVSNDGKLQREITGSRGDIEHLENFAECVRSRRAPNANIIEGHRSALFCHLGNISYRLGRTVQVDSSTGRLADDRDAQNLWQSERRPGWMPSLT